MAHQFSHYVDGFILRADCIELDQLAMTQLLHYLRLGKEVLRVHRTYNSVYKDQGMSKRSCGNMLDLHSIRSVTSPSISLLKHQLKSYYKSKSRLEAHKFVDVKNVSCVLDSFHKNTFSKFLKNFVYAFYFYDN